MLKCLSFISSCINRHNGYEVLESESDLEAQQSQEQQPTRNTKFLWWTYESPMDVVGSTFVSMSMVPQAMFAALYLFKALQSHAPIAVNVPLSLLMLYAAYKGKREIVYFFSKWGFIQLGTDSRHQIITQPWKTDKLSDVFVQPWNNIELNGFCAQSFRDMILTSLKIIFAAGQTLFRMLTMGINLGMSSIISATFMGLAVLSFHDTGKLLAQFSHFEGFGNLLQSTEGLSTALVLFGLPSLIANCIGFPLNIQPGGARTLVNALFTNPFYRQAVNLQYRQITAVINDYKAAADKVIKTKRAIDKRTIISEVAPAEAEAVPAEPAQRPTERTSLLPAAAQLKAEETILNQQHSDAVKLLVQKQIALGTLRLSTTKELTLTQLNNALKQEAELTNNDVNLALATQLLEEGKIHPDYVETLQAQIAAKTSINLDALSLAALDKTQYVGNDCIATYMGHIKNNQTNGAVTLLASKLIAAQKITQNQYEDLNAIKTALTDDTPFEVYTEAHGCRAVYTDHYYKDEIKEEHRDLLNHEKLDDDSITLAKLNALRAKQMPNLTARALSVYHGPLREQYKAILPTMGWIEYGIRTISYGALAFASAAGLYNFQLMPKIILGIIGIAAKNAAAILALEVIGWFAFASMALMATYSATFTSKLIMDIIFNRRNDISFMSTKRSALELAKIILICGIGAAANAYQNKVAEVTLFGSEWLAIILSFLSPVIIEVDGYETLNRQEKVNKIVEEEPDLAILRDTENGLKQFPFPPSTLFKKAEDTLRNNHQSVPKQYWTTSLADSAKELGSSIKSAFGCGGA